MRCDKRRPGVWMRLFLLLLAVPIVEIALFIQLGDVIGLWPTLALIILTAVIGTALMRAQGFAALQALQRSLEEGGDPKGPLADGAMILLAGLLLLTPGFFTDAIGFALLAPPIRAAIKAWAAPRIAMRAAGMQGRGPARRPGGPEAPVDADFTVIHPEPVASGPAGADPGEARRPASDDRPSGWRRPSDDG